MCFTIQAVYEKRKICFYLLFLLIVLNVHELCSHYSVCVFVNLSRVILGALPLLSLILPLAFAVTSPQETTLPEDSESCQRKLDSAPETSTVQQLMTSTETEKPPEMSTKLSENISQHEDDSKSCQELLKTNQSPTKEPTPASHVEEPMEVSFTEEASTKAAGVCVDPEVTAAKISVGVQKVEEEKMEVVVRKHDTIAEIHTEEMDINGDERSLAKLSSLVEERTMFKQSLCRQPEGLPLFSQVGSQPQLLPQIHAGPTEAISNVPSSTFIPLTPKIGMGKPAISKRKFSPGRPRVKQVRHEELLYILQSQIFEGIVLQSEKVSVIINSHSDLIFF